MLKLYIAERDSIPDSINIIHDVEKEFSLLERVECNEYVKKILKYVEQAEWCDGYSFIDRLGYKIHNSELSTGCKAAILVGVRQDSLIDLVECGANARNAIITFAKNGNILMNEDDIELKLGLFDKSEEIEIEVNGRIFYNIQDLNDYLQYGYYDEVD